MQRVYLEDLLLSFVRFKEGTYILLANNDVLSAVKKENGEIQEIEMHHEVSFKDVKANELLHLAFYEVKHQTHKKTRNGLIVVLSNVENNLNRWGCTYLSLRKGVSRMRQKMWRG